MKLLHPITGRGPDGAVRYIVVVHGRNPHSSYRSGLLARSYLDLVCEGPQRIRMICDSALPAVERSSLQSALAMIDADDVDLVICTDLTRISREHEILMDFLKRCAQHTVRVIGFEDCIDTADSDWQNKVASLCVSDDSETLTSEEGGAT